MKSFVDDLALGRGVVLSRAATTLRSIETKPFRLGDLSAQDGHASPNNRSRMIILHATALPSSVAELPYQSRQRGYYSSRRRVGRRQPGLRLARSPLLRDSSSGVAARRGAVVLLRVVRSSIVRVYATNAPSFRKKGGVIFVHIF